MDFIGNDVNYAVTESVFKAFYYDPRYRPSHPKNNMLMQDGTEENLLKVTMIMVVMLI